MRNQQGKFDLHVDDNDKHATGGNAADELTALKNTMVEEQKKIASNSEHVEVLLNEVYDQFEENFCPETHKYAYSNYSFSVSANTTTFREGGRCCSTQPSRSVKDIQ